MSAHDPTSDLDCERNIIRECAGALEACAASFRRADAALPGLARHNPSPQFKCRTDDHRPCRKVTKMSSQPYTESARLRWKLWRERSAELLSDLEAFLPTSDGVSADSQSVPTCSLPPWDSQATRRG
jgi:hypothetical protein